MGTIYQIIGLIIFGAGTGVGTYLFWYGGHVKQANAAEKNIHKIEEKITDTTSKVNNAKNEILDEIKSFEKTFSDINNNKLDNFKDVEVLDDKIIDAYKGYIRIKVNKEYLNSDFDVPVTLSYKSGRYQPVTLTFTNDKQWGAGIIFTSPEHKKRASIYLNQCFRFEGGGKMIYTTDLIFELYFNDYCIYFVTNSGEFKFERGLPPMRYGRNKCIGYFDENNEKNKQASADFPTLEAYFNKYK